MAELKDNRLVSVFEDLRREGRKTVLPFITSGYPDLDTTRALLRDFESRGVRAVELGFPFSDPVADGPVIQASYTEALSAGVNADATFEMVRRYRDSGGLLAISAMASYSIVYRHGVEEFLAAASEAGFDGLIIPDLPLDETTSFQPLAVSHGLCNIMLIAPTTPPERRVRIARHSRGFIYFVSIAGITGERDRLPEETIADVAELRTHTDTPVCVGFGISNPDTVRAVCEVSDGAIVGSAIVHRIADAIKAGLTREQLVRKTGEFITDLLAPVT